MKILLSYHNVTITMTSALRSQGALTLPECLLPRGEGVTKMKPFSYSNI